MSDDPPIEGKAEIQQEPQTLDATAILRDILTTVQRLEFGQGYLATKVELSNLHSDITADITKLRSDMEEAQALLRTDVAEGQKQIMGSINGWMDRLRNDQERTRGHATMAFTVAEGQSSDVKMLLELFYQLQKRIQDIDERHRLDDKH